MKKKKWTKKKRTKHSALFRPLYTSKKRYFLVTGGRGSLKSTTVQDYIALLTYEAGHGVLYTRYTMESAKDSVIPGFVSALERLGIEKDFKVVGSKVTNRRTGSFVIFKGIKTSSGDQTGRLKSIEGITTLVVEEGEDFNDEAAFDIIDDSIRTSGIQNRIIWIQNPTTKEHFIYKKFIEKYPIKRNYYGYDVTVSNHPDVEHIHTTYHIAEEFGYLDKGWLKKCHKSREEAYKKEIDVLINTGKNGAKYKTHYYYNYIGGWLERAEGVIFDNWEEGKFDVTIPYCYGLDWGYNPDPLAMGKIAVDKRRKRIYVKQIIYETELDDVESKLKQCKIRKRDLIVCDTNEARTRKSLIKKGWNFQKAKKAEIAADIREIKKWTIIVDNTDNCSVDFIKELNNYEWNDKKSSIPIDAFNHLIDEMRYAFNRLTKNKKGVRRRK